MNNETDLWKAVEQAADAWNSDHIDLRRLSPEELQELKDYALRIIRCKYKLRIALGRSPGKPQTDRENLAWWILNLIRDIRKLKADLAKNCSLCGYPIGVPSQYCIDENGELCIHNKDRDSEREARTVKP